MTTERTLSPTAIAPLRTAFSGEIVLPDDPDYDRARIVWNALADRRPAIIARCAHVEDVVGAVRFARERNLVLAVRGGGHSVAGFSTCDGGMVLDLSGMRRVEVDPEHRVARVDGGALLEQLDTEAQRFGLACPVGVVGHTGVGGLTLGGGMGRLQRKHGFTIDNLLAAEIVTADGRVQRASATENPELFWGLRGAGANFGVVTSFEFRLHPIGPGITHGAVAFPIEKAREAAALYRDLARTAPRHMHLGLNVTNAPDTPAFRMFARRPIVSLVSAHSGEAQHVERDLEPLRRTIEPLADTFSATTYLAVQKQADEEMGWGKRFYMKGGFLGDLTDAAIDVAAAQVAAAPGDCAITIWAQTGAPQDVPEDATAFAGRSAPFWLGAEAFWSDPAADAAHIAWGRSTMAALEPFTAAGHYVNDMVESSDDIVRSIYGDAKYERLRGLKRRYDPDNVFRLNQNIRP